MVPERGRPKAFRLLLCRPQIFDNSDDAKMPMRDTGAGWQRMRDFSLLSLSDLSGCLHAFRRVLKNLALLSEMARFIPFLDTGSGTLHKAT